MDKITRLAIAVAAAKDRGRAATTRSGFTLPIAGVILPPARLLDCGPATAVKTAALTAVAAAVADTVAVCFAVGRLVEVVTVVDCVEAFCDTADDRAHRMELRMAAIHAIPVAVRAATMAMGTQTIATVAVDIIPAADLAADADYSADIATAVGCPAEIVVDVVYLMEIAAAAVWQNCSTRMVADVGVIRAVSATARTSAAVAAATMDTSATGTTAMIRQVVAAAATDVSVKSATGFVALGADAWDENLLPVAAVAVG